MESYQILIFLELDKITTTIFQEVDPFMYCSPWYLAFSRGVYDLMVKDLLGEVKVTLDALCDVARGAPLNLHAWRRMKSQLMLGNESAMHL